MRLLRVALPLSLLLNVALATAVVVRSGRNTRAFAASAGSTAANDPTSANQQTASGPPAARLAVAGPTSVSGNISTNGNSWTELNRGDARTLLARLNAAGFPHDVVVAMVKSVVSARTEARRQELTGESGAPPYWQRPPYPTNEPAKVRELRTLAINERQELSDLLGADAAWSDDDISRARTEKNVGNLSPEKRDALNRIIYEMFAREMKALPTDRPLLKEDMVIVDQAREAQRAAIAKLLTAEELAEYNLHTSATANRLRNILSSGMVDISENEYRALYQAYAPIWEDQRDPSTLTPEQRAARAQAEAQVKEEVKLALGPERAAAFELATAPQTRAVADLVSNLDLPTATARDVATLHNDFQSRAKAVQADAALSSDARAAQLTALAQEAKTRITAVLGPRGYVGYVDGPGRWINQLAKPTRAAADGSPHR